jgi:hypothetical protein
MCGKYLPQDAYLAGSAAINMLALDVAAQTTSAGRTIYFTALAADFDAPLLMTEKWMKRLFTP